jgi:hypothetical protein
MTTQDLMPFEAEAFAIEAAKCEAQRAAEQQARAARTEAKQAAKILAARQREQRRAEEEMAKNTRRWKREEATRKRNDTLTAQCGINWYSRRRDAGIYWTHCRTCGQLLHYTDDKNAQPQVCAGHKP